MEEKDVRWEQRFSNYKKALDKLQKAINYMESHSNESGNPKEDSDFVGSSKKLGDK